MRNEVSQNFASRNAVRDRHRYGAAWAPHHRHRFLTRSERHLPGLGLLFCRGVLGREGWLGGIWEIIFRFRGGMKGADGSWWLGLSAAGLLGCWVLVRIGARSSLRTGSGE